MNIKKSILERKRKYDLAHFEKTKYGKNLHKLKGKYTGKRCFIIGNGPSLTANDLDYLKDEYTFAFNRIYYIFDKTEWRPTFYCTQDYKIALNSIEEINKKIITPYIFAPINLKWYYDIKLNTQYYFCQNQSFSEKESPIFSQDISHEVGVGNTVAYTAFQLAVYMGFKEIYLIGVDHNFHFSQDKNGKINVDENAKDYFCKDYNEDKENLFVPRLDLSTLAYISAKDYAQKNGVKIYNATRGGKLEVFERKSFEEIIKENKKMNKNISQVKIGIILNYINLILGNLIPIFYTPIMLKLMGINEYGLYKLSANVTSYLSLISLGIGSAVIRFLIQARIEEGKKGEERILGLFLIIFKIISVITFIFGLFLALNLHLWFQNSLTSYEIERMRILVFILACNLSLSFSMTPYISIVSSHEKFVFLQLMNIFTTCIGPVLNLMILFLGYKSIGMAISTLVISVVTRLMYYFYVKKIMNIHPKFEKNSSKILKTILIFSFWIFLENVVTQLYNATDSVMIGAIPGLGTNGVAIYNIGLTFNSIMLSMTVGISNILSPKINMMVFQGASSDDLTNYAIKVGRLQCFIMLLVVTGFIAFGRPFIYFYAGKDFYEAYWVAILMMIPNMIPLAQSVCLSVIYAQNRHQFRSLVYLGIAIINVIGTWILMKYMGIIGAALMTGVALFIGQGLVMNWYYQKCSGINIKFFWRKLSSTMIIPILLCVFTLIISKIIDFYNLNVLMMGIIIYTLIYLFATWKLVFNSYERELFGGFLLKIKK